MQALPLSPGQPVRWRFTAVRFAVGGLLLAAVAGCQNHAVTVAGTAPAAGPHRIVLGEQAATRIDVGDVARGGRWEVPFVVSNPGPAAVTIGPIGTSCDCLRVELDATWVEAGTEVSGRAVIDLSHEPTFTGGLLLAASASIAESGGVVFTLNLSVRVK